MDSVSIAEFLANKTIFVTGATGFIAKILVEKILRIQPNVKKLYLLIRATEVKSVDMRLQDEVLGKEVFNVLREKLGTNFESLVSEKITPVAGDTSYKDLGLTANLLKELCENIDIVINVAASTKFDERYDVALGVNSLGAKHVVDLANKCTNIKLLIHVSTAYVCGEKQGLIAEETLNCVPSSFNIESEKLLVEDTLKILKASDLPTNEIKQRMKNLGSQRAKKYGWPNTYVFTKAIGEMLVEQHKGDLPVIIMRPTIVCSTLKEPFPGWVEGCRTIDSFIVAYGKGNLRCVPANKSSILDLIPADMFVNAMIVAMKAHENQRSLTVYQVGSSYRNPLSFHELSEFMFSYFKKSPWINSEGNQVKVGKGLMLNNALLFKIILFQLQILAQMILLLANRIGYTDFQRLVSNLDKKMKFAIRLVDLHKPYLLFKGIFEDINTEKLILTARENGLNEDAFNFDSMSINWKDYFINIHLPSVVKYLF